MLITVPWWSNRSRVTAVSTSSLAKILAHSEKALLDVQIIAPFLYRRQTSEKTK